MQSTIIYALASASRGFMHGLNTTSVMGGEVMEAALRCPEGQALITVCNHIAAMDDPLVMSAVIPPAFYSHPKSIRCVKLQSPPAVTQVLHPCIRLPTGRIHECATWP